MGERKWLRSLLPSGLRPATSLVTSARRRCASEQPGEAGRLASRRGRLWCVAAPLASPFGRGAPKGRRGRPLSRLRRQLPQRGSQALVRCKYETPLRLQKLLTTFAMARSRRSTTAHTHHCANTMAQLCVGSSSPQRKRFAGLRRRPHYRSG